MSRQTHETIKYATLRCVRIGTRRVYTYDQVRKPGLYGGFTVTNVRHVGVTIIAP